MKKTIMKIAAFASLLAMPFLGTDAMGQELKRLTMDDVMPGGKTYHYTENLYGLQWWGDICIKPSLEEITAIHPSNGKTETLFTLEELNRGLEAAGQKRIRHLYSVAFPWGSRTAVLIQYPDRIVAYNWKSGKVESEQKFTHKSQNIDYNIASGNIAYTEANNLFVNGKAVTDEPKGVVCGQTVHRNEFGISKGTFWSPKGDKLAFYRMDERMVTKYPLVDITKRIGKVDAVRYPMAGMKSHKVTVGIYSPQTGKTVYLNAGDPTDRYFTNISWAPDEKSLYLIELNRDQNHSKLCQYNVESGELMKVLLEEKDEKYVEPQHPITFLPWNDRQFIYQSQRSGYNHLYLYDVSGKLIKELTEGDWLVKSIVGFNEKAKEIIITSTEISPLQSNIYKIKVSSGKRTLLDGSEGVHRPQLSESGSWLTDNYSTPTVARQINIVNEKNGKTMPLFTAPNPWEGYQLPTVETGTIKAADGVTDLYYRMMKPADFDPNKKYPVIIYVYGGPHAQMITNGFMNDARGWDLYMPQKGYIMFTLDNRGSSNRGRKFEDVTFRHLGVEECKDQMKGVEFMKSLPYIDSSRMGIHGWSFGGHMTIGMMLRHPGLFKAGVAGGPVVDWKYYEIMYGERYMDRPQDNPEGYKETNLKNYADRLQDHLLIIHDDHDDTCVPQHTLSFLKACVDARTYPDLFIYPGHKHNVIGIDRVHLYEKITRYFDDFMK